MSKIDYFEEEFNENLAAAEQAYIEAEKEAMTSEPNIMVSAHGTLSLHADPTPSNLFNSELKIAI